MTEFSNSPQPQTEAGIASVEDGLVVLDGPDGIAITMTPDAAQKTGASLISAAERAGHRIKESGTKSDV